MQIGLFGATGGTGLALAQQALDAGHSVTALVRTPAKLTLEHPRLTVVQGDVLDPPVVDQVVAGQEAVVVSLGNTPNNPDKVVANGTQNIIRSMRQFGVERLIVVTSLGVGDSKDQVPAPLRIAMRTVLRKVMADKELQEQRVRDSGLAWTIVRPGGLTDGPATGDYRAGTDPSIVAGRVARADVAAFILSLLEGQPTYLRQAVAIS